MLLKVWQIHFDVCENSSCTLGVCLFKELQDRSAILQIYLMVMFILPVHRWLRPTRVHCLQK